MNGRKDALGREVTVGDKADEERRDHGRERGGAEYCSGLGAREMQGRG